MFDCRRCKNTGHVMEQYVDMPTPQAPETALVIPAENKERLK